MNKTLFLILIFIVVLCQAKRHHKKDGHQKKSEHLGFKNAGGVKSHGAHLKNGWLHLKEVSGCNCPTHQICVSGPATHLKPTCVTKHFLKEGKKFFRQFKHHRFQKATFFKERPLLHPRPLHDSPAIIDKPHDLQISVHAKRKHHNDVKPKKEIVHPWKFHSGAKKHHQKTCSLDDFKDMRERLTGWFRLLHAEDRQQHPHPRSFHHKDHRHLSVKKELRHHHEGRCKCLKSVMWEMRHLDTNKDHHLSQSELSVIENNGREPCLKPFLLSCDHNQDDRLSRNEWCCCYAEVLPPCFQKLREVQVLLKTHLDSFVPRCDKEGFFEKEQCSGRSYDTKTCWCVDLNGNEVNNTKSRGKANCRNVDLLGHKKN